MLGILPPMQRLIRQAAKQLTHQNDQIELEKMTGYFVSFSTMDLPKGAIPLCTIGIDGTEYLVYSLPR